MWSNSVTAKTVTADQIIDEVYKLVGERFPIQVVVDQEQIKSLSYETEWEEGTTKAVENKKGEVVDYKPSYTKKKLTAVQVKTLEKYITANVKG